MLNVGGQTAHCLVRWLVLTFPESFRPLSSLCLPESLVFRFRACHPFFS